MAEPTPQFETADLPQAQVAGKRRSTFSLVWIVPLLAVIIGAWLAWKTISEKGPTFVIQFKTAEGLEAGKTRIKYKSVDVGTVETIELSRDRSTVLVHARMQKYAKSYLIDDSRFWVVRARVTGATVQGLGTLLTGAYIGMDVGKSKQATRIFTGLEEQPIVTADVPGRHFVLKSPVLGSFSLGSPVYFRKFAVGEVESYELDKDGKGVTVRIFIGAPHDQYVNTDSRFWEASGLDVKLDATGVSVDTESLTSILVGGIAFQTRGDGKGAESAAEDAAFRLYENRATALAHRDTVEMPFTFHFKESVRGLSIGAPVDFRGIVIGEVTDIRPQYENEEIYMVVFASIYPERMASRQIGETRVDRGRSRQQAIDELIRLGLRAPTSHRQPDHRAIVCRARHVQGRDAGQSGLGGTPAEPPDGPRCALRDRAEHRADHQEARRRAVRGHRQGHQAHARDARYHAEDHQPGGQADRRQGHARTARCACRPAPYARGRRSRPRAGLAAAGRPA